DFFFNDGHALQIGKMSLRIRINDYARVEEVVGIDQLLEALHNGITILAPLHFYKGRHVASGTVFCFKGAVITHYHQLHQIFEEASVLRDRRLIIKRLSNDEVEVAILGMTEDDAVFVSVLNEQPLQFLRAVGQALDGKCYVFDDDCSAALTHCTDGG